MNDSISQVKLGDFGLAVLSSSNSGTNAGDEQTDANGGNANAGSGGGGGGAKPGEAGDVHALSRQDSITDCVGTHFYSAPEQRARGVHYDHKVDMYVRRCMLESAHSDRRERCSATACNAKSSWQIRL